VVWRGEDRRLSLSGPPGAAIEAVQLDRTDQGTIDTHATDVHALNWDLWKKTCTSLSLPFKGQDEGKDEESLRNIIFF
jgi:hypothetical protein